MKQNQTQKTSTETKTNKWEVVYEDEDCISIWRYNSKITTNGPVEVEYKYKRGYVHPGTKKKTLGELSKESKRKKVSD
jgi:hypothetical protein